MAGGSVPFHRRAEARVDIGGTTGDEVVRLADLVIKEYEAWDAGQPLTQRVTKEVFATMG